MIRYMFYQKKFVSKSEKERRANKSTYLETLIVSALSSLIFFFGVHVAFMSVRTLKRRVSVSISKDASRILTSHI